MTRRRRDSIYASELAAAVRMGHCCGSMLEKKSGCRRGANVPRFTPVAPCWFRGVYGLPLLCSVAAYEELYQRKRIFWRSNSTFVLKILLGFVIDISSFECSSFFMSTPLQRQALSFPTFFGGSRVRWIVEIAPGSKRFLPWRLARWKPD